MSWVCTNCSTSNEDGEACCVVCGVTRPDKTKHSAVAGEAVSGKIVFSDFEAWKESVKSFFGKLSAGKKEKKPRKKAEKPATDASPAVKPGGRVTPETPETPATTAIPAADASFATPWPEHKIKFDEPVIRSKGFVKSERETLSGVNGYRFYKSDGTSQFIRMELLVVQKLATKLF